MDYKPILCQTQKTRENIQMGQEKQPVPNLDNPQQIFECPLEGKTHKIKNDIQIKTSTMDIAHENSPSEVTVMNDSNINPLNSVLKTFLAKPNGKFDAECSPDINKIERQQPVQLPIKAKSCMKFTRNSKTNRTVNDFETNPESRWNTWKRMCTEYESDKSLKYDVFKSKIEKFKIPRQPVSYEADPDPVIKTTSIDGVKNDSVIEGMVSKINPEFNYRSDIESSTKAELENIDPTESDFDSFSEDEMFLLPSIVKCNYSNITPFLPHLKGTIRTNEHKLVAYFLDDTGASHSMVSQQWLKKYHPHAKIRVFKQNFTACGKTQSKGIVGQVRLTITFEGSDNEKIKISDDFYIVTEVGNLEFILGRSVLGDMSLVKKQTPVDITFYKKDKEITVPFVNMNTSQQNTTVQINNINITDAPLPSTLILSPVDEIMIPANTAMYVKCYLPEIQKIDAPPLHGKTILVGRDNMSDAQALYAPATLDVLSKCHVDEFSRLTCTTRIHNQSRKNFTVKPSHVLGYGTFVDNIEEGKMSYEELFQSKEFLDDLTMDQLRELKCVIDTKLQKDNNLDCNHSDASNPIIIPLEDDFDQRDPRYHGKANWRPRHDQNITDDLNITELRPDMVQETEMSQLSEEKYLEQFDLDHLSDETQSLFKDIFLQVRTTFATEALDIGKTPLIQMELPTTPGKCAFQKQRVLSSDKLNFLKPVIDLYLDKNIIELAEKSNFASNLVLVVKPIKSSPSDLAATKLAEKQKLASTFRIAQDLRQVNMLIEKNVFPLGNINEIVAKTQNTLCSVLDINSAFTHVEIVPKDRYKTSFYVGNKLYQWTRMTQGLCTAPATFSLLMSKVFSQETAKILAEQQGPDSFPPHWVDQRWDEFVSSYLDDVLIHTAPGPNMEFGSKEHYALHVQHTKRVLLALKHADLKISPTKSDWGQTKFKLLGFTIDTKEQQISMDKKKAQAIIDGPRPANLSDIQIFLAQINYWEQFIPRFREIAYPLSSQMKTKQFIWTKLEEDAWNDIRELIACRVTLTLQNVDEPLFLFCDSSFWALASILVQLSYSVEDKDRLNPNMNILGCHSKLFTATELRQSIFYKESLAMIQSIRHFSTDLYQNRKNVTIFTDAKGIAYFYRNKQFSQRFNLASDFLASHLAMTDLTIASIPGKYNILADLFSRAFHTMSDIERKELFILSKDRANEIPPVDPYLQFNRDEVFRFLTESPLPEKSDKGNKLPSETKNEFDLVETILFHMNKAKLKLPEVHYMEYEMFRKGFGDKNPPKQFSDKSTIELNPPIGNHPGPERLANEDWRQGKRDALHKVREARRKQIETNTVDTESTNLSQNHQWLMALYLENISLLYQYIGNIQYMVQNGLIPQVTSVRSMTTWHDLIESPTTIQEAINTLALHNETMTKENKLICLIAPLQIKDQILINDWRPSLIDLLDDGKAVHFQTKWMSAYIDIVTALRKLEPIQTFNLFPTIPIKTDLGPNEENLPRVTFTRLVKTHQTCEPTRDSLVFSKFRINQAAKNIAVVKLDYTIFYPQHIAIKDIKISNTNVHCTMPTLNPFQSQALQPTIIHLQSKIDASKVEGKEKLTISFTQPIKATEITTADAILLPPKMRGWISPDSIHTVKETIQQLPLMDEVKNDEPKGTEIIAVAPQENIDQSVQVDPEAMSEPIQILDQEESTLYDPDQNLFEMVPETYQGLTEIIPYSINNIVVEETEEEIDSDALDNETNGDTCKLTEDGCIRRDENDQQEHLTAFKQTYVKNMLDPFEKLTPEQLPDPDAVEQKTIFHSIFFPEKSISVSNLISLQGLDDKLKPIIQDIDKYKDYKLVRGVLVYQPDERQKPLIEIPASMATSLYMSIHQAHLHPCPQVTKAIFHKFYHTDRLDYKAVHKNCLPCISNRNIRPKSTLGAMRSMDFTAPRQGLYVDVKDSLKPVAYGNKHVLCCIDAFSQYVTFICLKNKTPGHMALRFYDQYLRFNGPLLAIYSDNSNSYLAAFKKQLVKDGVITYASTPYHQQADFAEVAVKLLGDKMTKLLSDPQFNKKHKNWPLILDDLALIINRCPMQHPFNNWSREMIHFGNESATACPFALELDNQDTFQAIQSIPKISEVDRYDSFSQYLLWSNTQLRSDRDEIKTIRDQRRLKRHENDPSRPRQLDSQAVPIGSLVYINDKYDKRSKPTSFHSKREIYRVMEKSYSGLTVISPSNGEVRTAPLRYCEPLTKHDFDMAYPREFFHEISRLSKDLYTRYHHSTDTFMKQIKNPNSDPHNCIETADINLESDDEEDASSCSDSDREDTEQMQRAFSNLKPLKRRLRQLPSFTYSK